MPDDAEQLPAPPAPPPTQTPAVVNQQINIHELPPSVWDRLSADQTVELAKLVIETVAQAEARRLDAESARFSKEEATSNTVLLYGFLSGLAVLGAVVYLGVNGQKELASGLGGSIVALAAVFVGKKVLK